MAEYDLMVKIHGADEVFRPIYVDVPGVLQEPCEITQYEGSTGRATLRLREGSHVVRVYSNVARGLADVQRVTLDGNKEIELHLIKSR